MRRWGKEATGKKEEDKEERRWGKEEKDKEEREYGKE
jgi:hypothetical protein